MKLSIVMMVKNESKYIERCLSAIQPIRDVIEAELIIVDTGSTDNTVEISQKYTNKIYYHEWKNDYAQMRNKCISYATGEWVMILDADEILENSEPLLEFISKDDGAYNTINVKIKNITQKNCDKESSFVILPRIFRKSEGIQYKGRIHEQAMYSHPILLSDISFVHFGYMKDDIELMKKKYERYVPLLKRQIDEEPNNPYHWFQLSVSYSMYNQNKLSFEAITKAFELAKMNSKSTIADYIYVRYCIANMEKNKYSIVEETCNEALIIYKNNIDLTFLISFSYARQYKDILALENYNKYLKLVDLYKNGLLNIDTRGAILYIYSCNEAYADMVRLYFRNRKYKEAVDTAANIDSQVYILAIQKEIVHSYLEQSKYRELLDYYNCSIQNSDRNLQEVFFLSIETFIENNQEKKQTEIMKMFKDINAPYGVLALCRLDGVDGDNKDTQVMYKKIQSLDFNTLPEYFGDIFAYMLKKDYPVENLCARTDFDVIVNWIAYLLKTENYNIEDVKNYLDRNILKFDTEFLKIGVLLLRSILYKDLLIDEEYTYFFKKYVLYGIEYVRFIYSENVIKEGNCHLTKNQEDAFFILMNQAIRIKDTDILGYMTLLKQSLVGWNIAIKGIKLLIKELQGQKNNISEEILFYQNNIKSLIKNTIESGEVDKAKELIKEYKKVCQNDEEIYSMQAVVAILDNDLYEAQKILESGLIRYIDNFDLLYNIAYVKELLNDKINADIFYKKSAEVCRDIDIKNQILSKIK